MDSFIEQITAIRKTLLGVSISALILAPLAIGLSIYLSLHRSSFAILEIENEFGLVLSILLGTVYWVPLRFHVICCLIEVHTLIYFNGLRLLFQNLVSL
jgi:hypothetical protein